MNKLAILQVADAGPLESLAHMLEVAGYSCAIPDDRLRGKLRQVFGGKGLVLGPKDLTARMGYAPVFVREVGVEAMGRCDLYCDVKAHQVYGAVVNEWPRLAGCVAYYRINGGRPEHVVDARGDHGDEVNPPCPVITPNQWYACDHEDPDHTGSCIKCQADDMSLPPTPNAYACWPPFVRIGAYSPGRRHGLTGYSPPVCLIHNAAGWGYAAEIGPMRGLGVKVYGAGSPDGLVPHPLAKGLLTTALAMVHLKSSDAPGYALYEALASGCPVICTERLIWRCKMGDLLVPGETCLTFDRRETHAPLTAAQVQEDQELVQGHLEALKDPAYNRRIGDAGRAKLESVMWDAGRDGPVFRGWTERVFS